MDYETATGFLDQPGVKKPSELGQAVDVLYGRHPSYKRIAKEVSMSEDRLRQLHRVFLLPEGIRWQVDEGNIRVGHAGQILRLQEDEQWLLAFSIVERKISVKDSQTIVNAVVRKSERLEDVLNSIIGIRFDEVAMLLLPMPFDERFKISRAAWSKKLKWADFSLSAIRQASEVDRGAIARELKAFEQQWKALEQQLKAVAQ